MQRAVICAMTVAALAAGCGLHADKPDGSGTIECTEVRVAPEVGGRIACLAVDEGAAVKKGELIAQLDATAYSLRREEARAGVAQAQAQLALMVAGSRDEDIQRARSQVVEAQAACGAATQDLQRVQAVFARGSATPKQRDDAQSLADRTAAVLAAAEQQLAKLLRGNRQEEIRIAQAQADQARARLAQMEKAVTDCTVSAPLDGVVTVKSAEEGEVVPAGAALVSIARLDEVWLAIYVPETRLAAVKLGQPAKVKVDGQAAPFAGTVTFISPEAEFSPKNVQTSDERAKLVYRVKITLENPKGVFKPGMPADGYIEAGGGRDAP